MSDSEKWKEESVTAVTSLSTTVVSATATGLPHVARASSGITFVIVNEFHFAQSPDAVPDRAYEELRAKIGNLEAQIEALPGPKTHAFNCKEDFDGCWQGANTKLQKWHCLMTYGWCLAQGFNVSFSPPG